MEVMVVAVCEPHSNAPGARKRKRKHHCREVAFYTALILRAIQPRSISPTSPPNLQEQHGSDRDFGFVSVLWRAPRDIAKTFTE